MREKQLQTENGSISYFIGGNKEKGKKCLVFIHGMLTDHTIFLEQIQYFKANYTIIALDVPLHGNSRVYDNFSFSRTAGEIKAILNLEKIKRAVFIGQSMGGYISQEFGMRYPNRVEALIAVDSHPFGHSYYRGWERFIMKRIGAWTSWLPYRLLATIISRNANDTKKAYQKTLDLITTYNTKQLTAIMQHVLTQFFEREESVSYSFPVLLVVGEKEITGYIKKHNKLWARKEGYPLAIISRAAHNSNMDNGREFNAVVGAFLERLT